MNETRSDATASLSADELTIYFGSDRDGVQWDIFTASRADRTDRFDDPVLLDVLNSPSDEGDISVTPDELEAYFISNRSGTFHIYVATRSTRTAEFSDPALVANVAGVPGSTTEWAPFITADGSNLYFATNATGLEDIYRATKTGGDFDEPAPVIELNTGSYADIEAALSPDELSIYFSSTRPDGGAKGDFDIWQATRSSKDEEFSGLVNVAELNTEGYERPEWVSADGCRLYFTAYDGALWHIYLAEKP
jgi:Tol biopolymer transport system component